MYVHVYHHNVVIGQVTGVILMCKPVGLINQCTVMWNVSVLQYYCMSCYICSYICVCIKLSLLYNSSHV